MQSLIPKTKTIVATTPDRLRVLLMGDPKSGKSSFCVQNPKALVIDTDNRGTDYLNCYRVNTPEWTVFQAVIKELVGQKDEKFSVIIIDTVDMLWQRCREYVCKREGLMHESDDKGFGRSWDMVKSEFLKAMSFIQSAGFGIWFTTHTSQKEIKVQGIKRTVTTSSLPSSACSLVLKMCDVIGYIDVQENGDRILIFKNDDSLPTGDRTDHLKENIRYSTPAEGYEKFSKFFETKETVK